MRPTHGVRVSASVGALAGLFTSHCHLNGHLEHTSEVSFLTQTVVVELLYQW